VDGTGAGLSFLELAPAQDAVLQYGTGLAAVLFTSDDNQFEDVIEGLDVAIEGESTDPVIVTVKQTSEAAAGALQTLVENYNKLREKLAAYTSLDLEANTKGILFASGEALRIDNDLSRLLTDRYFGVGEVQTLAELGISVNEQGELAFDRTKFDERYAADPDAVEEFLTDEEQGFAAKADKVLERLVGKDNSALVTRAATLNRQVEDSERRIGIWDERLSRQRERLLLEFYRLENTISKMRAGLSAIQSIQVIPPLVSASP
jgi:flagellar hook-associated protein 2